jgi:hypothetical protein
VPTPEQSNGRPSDEALEQGVLSNLPRTRPQRATERRIAARARSKPASPGGGASKDAKAKTKAARKTRARAAAGTTAAGADAAGKTRARAPQADTAPVADVSATREHGGSTSSASAAPSPRRAATAKRAKPKRATSAGKPRSRAAKAGARARTTEPAPRQGFEAEGERASGPVQPPGGAELVASAAEIVGEIAKAGVSAGERVLKDVLSRLRP